MRAKTEDAILQSVISKRYLSVSMSSVRCGLVVEVVGGDARWPVLSFEVAFWSFHFHRTKLQLAALRYRYFTILARASHQSRVLNESGQLLTYKSTLNWKACARVRHSCLPYTTMKELPFREADASVYVESRRCSPELSRVYPLGQQNMDLARRTRGCPLRKLMKTNGRSFKLRFGMRGLVEALS